MGEEYSEVRPGPPVPTGSSSFLLEILLGPGLLLSLKDVVVLSAHALACPVTPIPSSGALICFACHRTGSCGGSGGMSAADFLFILSSAE